MNVPPHFAKRLEKLAASTGVDAETYLRMALEDWFLVSAPTYRNVAVKRRAEKPSVCKIYKLQNPASAPLHLLT